MKLRARPWLASLRQRKSQTSKSRFLSFFAPFRLLRRLAKRPSGHHNTANAAPNADMQPSWCRERTKEKDSFSRERSEPLHTRARAVNTTPAASNELSKPAARQRWRRKSEHPRSR